jgi:hypothetical protein
MVVVIALFTGGIRAWVAYAIPLIMVAAMIGEALGHWVESWVDRHY